MAFALDDELQNAEERLALEAALAFMDSELHSSVVGSSAVIGSDGGSSVPDASASLLPAYLFGDELQQQQQPVLRVDEELRLFDISGSEPEGEFFSLEALTAVEEDDAGLDELSFRFGSSDASVASPPPSAPQDEQLITTSIAQPRPKRRQKAKQQLSTAAAADTKPKRKVTPKANDDSNGALTTTAAMRSERRKPLNYNPNKARDERREELIYLRGKVQELETQLDDIKQKRPRITASALAPTLAMSTSSSSSSMYAGFTMANATGMDSDAAKMEAEPLQQQQLVVAGVWQDIATRQCEGRIKAERENIRLKIILENQIKIAKSLEKLLKKKVAARDIEHCPQCQQLHHVYPPTKDPRTDAQIFEDLAAGVELSYKEVDAVFAANGLAQMEIPHSDARMRSDDSHGMFLELLANKVLPFDVHATATAAWHYFVYAKQRTPSRSYFFDSPKVPINSVIRHLIAEKHGLTIVRVLKLSINRMLIRRTTPLWKTLASDCTPIARLRTFASSRSCGGSSKKIES